MRTIEADPEPVTFIGAEGNRLEADRYGSVGHPVLMLHGGGQTRYSWDAAAGRIAGLGHVVYSLDQRGHGKSDWVPSGHYGFADFAADLIAVARQIEQREGAKPVLVGASLGGLAGLLAEGDIAPGLLSALVLVDVTPRMDQQGVSKILGFMAERVEEGFASVEEAAEAIARYIPDRKRPKDLSGLSKNLRPQPDGRYRWHWDPAFIKTKPEAHSKKANDVQDRLLKAAGRLELPVLLVRGQKSELVSRQYADEFLALVPHAGFVDIEDAGHMVAGDKNDVFADAIERFLTSLFAGA
ncbi:peroxidase [Roseibium aquae]|uniref:Peroxidase n=1 Tax=Roseibium aquae TaxID=1323746 RepID=A0A916TN79_9HYPH|nr:alpha/beta hydrolase [Roseibium aquae]GGB59508.1 peroxidase [Roseibium aquae]